MHHRAFIRRWIDIQRAADYICPVVHDLNAYAIVIGIASVKALAVVTHRDVKLVYIAIEVDIDQACVGMFDSIIGGFLRDTIDLHRICAILNGKVIVWFEMTVDARSVFYISRQQGERIG